MRVSLLAKALLLCATLITLSLGLSAAAFAKLLIAVDKNRQEMIVARDGDVLHVWPVSTGRSGYATPSGSYTPFRLEKEHYSKEWDDAPMPNSIFFTKQGHAIHGSLETKRLGTAASHGCVRLAPENASVLYALVEETGLINVKVVVSGSEPLIAQKPKPRAPTARPRDGGPYAYYPAPPRYYPPRGYWGYPPPPAYGPPPPWFGRGW